MQRRQKFAVLLAIATLPIAATGVATVIAGSKDSGLFTAESAAKFKLSPAAGPITPMGALDTGLSEEYVGITPCRIVDTRTAGGPIISASRNFDVSGNLAAQGGGAACGIPERATSIAVNLTGISYTSSTGFARAWAAGGTEPTATLLNFSPALNASNLVNIPLCKGTCADAFTLKVYGKANIVADVVGYYQAPAFAIVDSAGTLVELDPGTGLTSISSGAVSAEKVDTGAYRVTFDREVFLCAATASTADVNGSGTVQPNTVLFAFLLGDFYSVAVATFDDTGAAADLDFYLTLSC